MPNTGPFAGPSAKARTIGSFAVESGFLAEQYHMWNSKSAAEKRSMTTAKRPPPTSFPTCDELLVADRKRTPLRKRSRLVTGTRQKHAGSNLKIKATESTENEHCSLPLASHLPLPQQARCKPQTARRFPPGDHQFLPKNGLGFRPGIRSRFQDRKMDQPFPQRRKNNVDLQ